MKIPPIFSRRKRHVHKNTFGHVLILAGSPRMLGASALCSLAAMRCGAGLVTLGIPRSLNATVHKKTSNEIMTLPLGETREGTLSLSAFKQTQKFASKVNVIALGPGLSDNTNTQKLIRKIISTSSKTLVIDADGLNALSGHITLLSKTKTPKILTPHPGEMWRLTGLPKKHIESNRRKIAKDFAQKNNCVLLLKGHRTVVASPEGKVSINTSGNAGMASAGTGDVLTGMIAALVAQGLSPFEAAKWGAFLHGQAGDLAAQSKTRLSLIASDIIDHIPHAIKSMH